MYKFIIKLDGDNRVIGAQGLLTEYLNFDDEIDNYAIGHIYMSLKFLNFLNFCSFMFPVNDMT